MNTKEQNEALWSDPSNWRCLGAIYWCPEDTRVWVPKPIKWTGWTLNFAHGAAWLWLLACLSPLLLIPSVVNLLLGFR